MNGHRRGAAFLSLIAGLWTALSGGPGSACPICPCPQAYSLLGPPTVGSMLACPPPVPPVCPPPPPVCFIEPEPVVPCPEDPPAPVVAIRVRVPAGAPAGKELHYRICVENCSPADAHHVVVRNPMPANAKFVKANPEPSQEAKGGPGKGGPGKGGPVQELQWQLGTLHGGEIRVIVLVLAPTGTSDVSNCARVQFEHGQCVTTRIAGLAPSPDGPGPGRPPVIKEKDGKAGKLIMSMGGPDRQYVNLPAQYFITVANAGTAVADNVLITNPIPDGMELVRAENGGKLTGNQVTWLLGALEPGAAPTLEIVLKAKGPGKICNRARAVADTGLSAEAEFCTVFQVASALLLEMIDRKDPVHIGEDTSYPIEVVNQGSIPVSNIRIKALIPEGMTLTRAKGPVNPPEKIAEKTADGYQVLLFDPLPSLAPGARAEYEVFVTARKAGDVRFKVEMTADQLKAGGPVREEESTTIYAEDVGGARPPGLETRFRRKISDLRLQIAD